MAKLTVGSKLPNFTYNTPFAQGKTIGETAAAVSGKTALVFLRYYGCTLCQYDIHQFKEEHAKIAATGGQMLVVLQSDPVKLSAQVGPDDLPFPIICDPDQALYHAFDIQPANSKAEMSDEHTIAKRAERDNSGLGLKHGEYEGNELQLPATFIVDSELNIIFAEYHKATGGVPSPDELAALLMK